MNTMESISMLVIEDEKPLQKAIKAKLEREGFDVVLAVEVNQGITYLEDPDLDIDAVWLDHYLFGKEDGLDFLSKSTEKGLLKGVPVFVVTNTGGHEKKTVYMAMGATKYFVKSSNRLDEIIADIKETIKNKIE